MIDAEATGKETELVAENWQRYKYGVDRGHKFYTESAKMLEGMYLGGGYDKNGKLQAGGQWPNQADLDYLDSQGRPAYEFNQIKSAIESAIGYQINNRMDISFKPRGGEATQDLADARSKVAMQIADNNKLHWLETDIFSDGMIQQRGYLEAFMDFDDSIEGELRIEHLDPLDVIPDPDAKSYDPAGWHDYIITRFLSLDQIEQRYGPEARKLAEQDSTSNTGDLEFGDDADGEKRNTFGTSDSFDARYSANKVPMFRIIDRRKHVRTVMQVAVHPGGDVRQLNGDETPEQMEQMRANGISIMKRMVNRVRWIVSTSGTLLHAAWSPYDRFNIIPFFPYFRGGKTRGMVDNAVGPQIALNKAGSQATHIINTTANSGWIYEQGSLVNMTGAMLEHFGAKTGLAIEIKKGATAPQKIQPNKMPEGMDRLITISQKFLQDATVPDSMRGVIETGQESGVAIQSRQHASQMILAVPLDNLARTRRMLGDWINYAISKYYDTQRVFIITRQEPLSGKEIQEPLAINEFDPETGEYFNDMTIGEYGVVITEQPMQVTFDNSQFTQSMEMREKGISIPDPFVIKHSNLTDKAEIIQAMEGANKANPVEEAKVELIKAQTDKAKAETVDIGVKSVHAAGQTAEVIAMNPAVAPLTDEILKSTGFEDKNAPPIVPRLAAPVAGPEPPISTDPLSPKPPVSPDIGVNQGIETNRAD